MKLTLSRVLLHSRKPTSGVRRAHVLRPSVGVIGVLGVLGVLGLLGCSQDETVAPPLSRPAVDFGVQVNRRGTEGADPLFVEAYQDLTVASLDLAQCAIDWGEIQMVAGVEFWEPFDAHVRRAIADEIPLSVQLLVIDNQARGAIPVDVDMFWIDEGFLRERIARFSRDLIVRGRGRVQYVWIGREVDAYLVENRGEIAFHQALLSACRDSIGRVDPAVRVGTTVNWTEAVARGRMDVVEAIAAYSPVLGLSIEPWDVNFAQVYSPTAVISDLRAAVDHFPAHTLAVTEVHYPTLEGDQGPKEQFVRELVAYLADAPASLQAIVWFPLHDFSPSAAAVRALRLYGGEAPREENYRQRLRTVGLKAVNAAPTPAWLTLRDWARGRPEE